jgi:hypothetical protein
MTEEAPMEGLSFSAFVDLKKSAFRFWRMRIDPNRPPKKETDAMRFGNVLHTVVFEPESLSEKYITQIVKTDYPGALETTDDIKKRLEELQVKPKGKRKDDFKQQLMLVDHNPVFWDEVLEKWTKENAGKLIIEKSDVVAAEYLAGYIRSHPDACRIIFRDDAKREQKIEWVNKMGIPMRGKFDLLVYIPEAEKLIMRDKTEMWGWILVELKSFSNPMEKDLDKIVTEKFSNDMQFVQLAIYGEAVEVLHGVKVDWFVTVFAETGDFPHVLVRANKADGLALSQGEQLYYELCRKFMYYHDKHGFNTPWVDDRQNLRLFQDEEFPIWIFN